MIFYPTFRDQASNLQKTFNQLSPGARALFSDTGEFFSPIGYLSSQIFYLMLPLLLGFLAIAAGSSLIGREEKEGTLELLLSRPISRGRLILSKAAVGIIITIFIGLVASLTTMIMAKVVHIAVPLPNIFWTGIIAIFLVISFGSIAFAVTMLGRGARAASVGVSTLIALGGYILVSLANTVQWLRWPAKIFPFNYYHPAEIMRGTYHWGDMLFIAGVIALCVFVSWSAFRRRDIGGNF